MIARRTASLRVGALFHWCCLALQRKFAQRSQTLCMFCTKETHCCSLCLVLGGRKVAGLMAVPRFPLTATAQIRMCGNSLAPLQAEALIGANFSHERYIAKAA